MIKEFSGVSHAKSSFNVDEYKFHIIHFVHKITDDAIYIDRIDDQSIKKRYLFEYLNEKGKGGWHYSHESRHESIIYLQKKVGENVKYEYQIIHCIEQHADGPILAQRVNEHKFTNKCLLADYLNKMGEKGFYLRGELKHQFCNIIERKKELIPSIQSERNWTASQGTALSIQEKL